MHGYVAFEDLSYLEVAEKKVHATIELRGNTEFNHEVYTAQTNEHGSYDLKTIPMGEYGLENIIAGLSRLSNGDLSAIRFHL